MGQGASPSKETFVLVICISWMTFGAWAWWFTRAIGGVGIVVLAEGSVGSIIAAARLRAVSHPPSPEVFRAALAGPALIINIIAIVAVAQRLLVRTSSMWHRWNRFANKPGWIDGIDVVLLLAATGFLAYVTLTVLGSYLECFAVKVEADPLAGTAEPKAMEAKDERGVKQMKASGQGIMGWGPWAEAYRYELALIGVAVAVISLVINLLK